MRKEPSWPRWKSEKAQHWKRVAAQHAEIGQSDCKSDHGEQIQKWSTYLEKKNWGTELAIHTLAMTTSDHSFSDSSNNFFGGWQVWIAACPSSSQSSPICLENLKEPRDQQERPEERKKKKQPEERRLMTSNGMYGLIDIASGKKRMNENKLENTVSLRSQINHFMWLSQNSSNPKKKSPSCLVSENRWSTRSSPPESYSVTFWKG